MDSSVNLSIDIVCKGVMDMDNYKVWSMSCNPAETQYNLEHEARVHANNDREAIEKTKKTIGEVKNREPQQVVENWIWRATKLP